MILLVAYLNNAVVDAIAVGDDVCMTGYIMDIFCIELGVLLDNRQITTLEGPENHSFHCLLDVPVCYNSGFMVLGEKDSKTSLHCLGPRLEESDVVIDVGRAAGSSAKSTTHTTCKTCSGDASKPVSGYRATVKGTVKDLGDGSSGVLGQPMLNNIKVLDFEVGCGEEDGIVVKNIGGECKILPSGTTSPSSAIPSLVSSIAPSESTTQQVTPSAQPIVSTSPTYPPTSSSSSTPSTFKILPESLDPSSSPSESITPSVSTQSTFLLASDEPSFVPSSSTPDCNTQFCEKALSDDYLLRYMLNVEDGTITMEVIYDGEAWVAVAFSEDENMPGSDAVIGSLELGNVPQKYRLLAKTPVVDSAIEIMPEEEQTLINATVEVRDGQTVMKFTKFLKEQGQIEIMIGLNNMLWAYGSSNTLSYHAQRSSFTLDLSSTDEAVNSAAPSFELSVAPSSVSSQIDCKPWPDAAWLQPNFCSNRFVDGLSRPRGLHIDHTIDFEILLVERGASRVVRLVPNNVDASDVSVVALPNTEGLGLNHGIELSGGYLYASSTTKVYRWLYIDGNAGETEEVIVGMRSGGHFTRTLAFDADGRWLYVSIGSLGNVASDSSSSRIRRFDMSSWGGTTPFNYDDDGELFADGLRNEVGLSFDVHGDLWGVENGADNLFREDLGGDIHNDNPSEELNRFREDQAGQSWGYPYCWSEYCLSKENGGSGIKGANTRWAWPSFLDAGYTDEWCRENTNESVMSMPAHSAPLGMTFYKWKDLSQDETCEGGFPRGMNNYAFIAFHGSWNRSVPTGYKVVFVPMDSVGNPTHQPIDLFRHAGDGAKWPNPGIRPVDVQFDNCGRLYITEDKTGSVIQVRYDGNYLDNFDPIETDVADGASCVAPEQSTSQTENDFTSFPTQSNPPVSEEANESSNEPSSTPTSELSELVRNLVNGPTSNALQLVIWWPVHLMMLLFQIL